MRETDRQTDRKRQRDRERDIFRLKVGCTKVPVALMWPEVIST